MNSDTIKKIESKLNEINLEISKVKKRAKLKIKDLQDSKSKLLQKLNADILKMMDGIPGDKIVEAIKKLKSFDEILRLNNVLLDQQKHFGEKCSE